MIRRAGGRRRFSYSTSLWPMRWAIAVKIAGSWLASLA
jgi:hypothetical protein